MCLPLLIHKLDQQMCQDGKDWHSCLQGTLHREAFLGTSSHSWCLVSSWWLWAMFLKVGYFEHQPLWIHLLWTQSDSGLCAKQLNKVSAFLASSLGDVDVYWSVSVGSDLGSIWRINHPSLLNQFTWLFSQASGIWGRSFYTEEMTTALLGTWNTSSTAWKTSVSSFSVLWSLLVTCHSLPAGPAGSWHRRALPSSCHRLSASITKRQKRIDRVLSPPLHKP